MPLLLGAHCWRQGVEGERAGWLTQHPSSLWVLFSFYLFSFSVHALTGIAESVLAVGFHSYDNPKGSPLQSGCYVFILCRQTISKRAQRCLSSLGCHCCLLGTRAEKSSLQGPWVTIRTLCARHWAEPVLYNPHKNNVVRCSLHFTD